MFINRLASSLSATKPFAHVTELLASGGDATLASPGLIRPALAATVYSAEPRPLLVVMAGVEAAE
jgi:hypothetical protein